MTYSLKKMAVMLAVVLCGGPAVLPAQVTYQRLLHETMNRRTGLPIRTIQRLALQYSGPDPYRQRFSA